MVSRIGKAPLILSVPLKKTAKVWPPAVNQVEWHPYHQTPDLVTYCKQEGIVLQAYASLGGQDSGKGKLESLGGYLMERAEVVSASQRTGATPAQVLLRFALQSGFVVTPKTLTTDRLEENGRAGAAAVRAPR